MEKSVGHGFNSRRARHIIGSGALFNKRKDESDDSFFPNIAQIKNRKKTQHYIT
jgi:hypothetical protein